MRVFFYFFCGQRISLPYQVLEKIDAVKGKRFRGADVSTIALSVKVQPKMLQGELIQHSSSSLSNEKARRDIVSVNVLYIFALMCYM